MHLPEMPGFGSSPVVPGRSHDPELFAEVLSEYLRANHLTNAPIVAMSFGCVTALKTALRGGTTGKLIFVGMPAHMDEHVARLGSLPLWLKRLLASSQWFRRRFIVPSLRQNVGVGTDSVAAHDAKTLKRMQSTTARAIADPDYADEINGHLRKYLRHVANEKVFIYGESDAQRKAARDIVSRPILIPGAGHNPFHDQPELIVKILLQEI